MLYHFTETIIQTIPQNFKTSLKNVKQCQKSFPQTLYFDLIFMSLHSVLYMWC